MSSHLTEPRGWTADVAIDLETFRTEYDSTTGEAHCMSMGTKDPDDPDNGISFRCLIENPAMFGLEDEAEGPTGTIKTDETTVLTVKEDPHEETDQKPKRMPMDCLTCEKCWS